MQGLVRRVAEGGGVVTTVRDAVDTITDLLDVLVPQPQDDAWLGVGYLLGSIVGTCGDVELRGTYLSPILTLAESAVARIKQQKDGNPNG